MDNTAKQPPRITAAEYFELTKDIEGLTELIDGQIVAMAGASELHQTIAGRLFSKIDGFILSNKGTCKAMLPPFDVVLDDGNIVQPDVLVMCDPSKRDGLRCIGAPDLVIEVTSTNRENDFDRKLGLYRKAGVREYWIVDTDNRKVWVFLFAEHPNVVNFYDWTDPIPVHIYGGQLTIRIEDLL